MKCSIYSFNLINNKKQTKQKKEEKKDREGDHTLWIIPCGPEWHWQQVEVTSFAPSCAKWKTNALGKNWTYEHHMLPAASTCVMIKTVNTGNEMKMTYVSVFSCFTHFHQKKKQKSQFTWDRTLLVQQALFQVNCWMTEHCTTCFIQISGHCQWHEILNYPVTIWSLKYKFV